MGCANIEHMFVAGETGRQIREALAAFPDDPSELPDEVVGKGFAELQRVVEAVEAKRLCWLAEQDRRAAHLKDGYLSTAEWLADGFGVAAGVAKGQVKVARALREMPKVREAFSNGELTSSAVRVLVEARTELPDEFSAREGSLVEQARSTSVEGLRRITACWSQAADAERSLERAEHLREKRRLDVCLTASGMMRVEGELDSESGEAVATALQAMVDAGIRSSGHSDRQTPSQRRADALAELALWYLDSGDRPSVGGEHPHLTVTVDVETLKRWREADGQGGNAGSVGARLDHSGLIHAEAARRMACDASVMRVVMEGESQPLDVGRRTPVIPPHLRRAVVVRDKACRFGRCDRPPAWCDAHQAGVSKTGRLNDRRGGAYLNRSASSAAAATWSESCRRPPQSLTNRVPVSPARACSTFSGLVTIASRPPFSRYHTMASIFGPMLPPAKCPPSARYFFAWASVSWSTHRWLGLP